MIVVETVTKRFRQLAHKPLSLKRLVLLQGLPELGPPVLDGVSLRVEAGETVGIVGKNGCGKTTLLRLIAGILRPDSGSVHVDGRIAPLLALGAGFHPDLTGRENVFLNAAILGVDRRTTTARFGEIAAFAGLGDHLDAPLRYYSSGMALRLGFSVAAHLDPDVLLVDEVLTVGDAAFRERCTDRIRTLQASGRSILLVSHDMEEIETFCQRCIWLADGRVAGEGEPGAIIPRYLESYAR